MKCVARLRAFSLVEMLILVLIVGVLLGLSAPQFGKMLTRYRLKSATDTLYYSLHTARSEAIKRNAKIRLNFRSTNGGVSWCYGLKLGASCDCTVQNSCELDGIERVVSSERFPNVVMEAHISSPGDHFTFKNMKWVMDATYGHVRFISQDQEQLRVIINRIGRIRLCSPEGEANVPGYSTAC